MANQKHVHKLKRHKYKSGNVIYFCTLPDCNFKMDVALSLGKLTICNLCGEEFVMNEATIKLAKPHCNNCNKHRVKGPDGKFYYVRKSSVHILEEIASENTEDLRSRLTAVSSPVLDEDI